MGRSTWTSHSSQATPTITHSLPSRRSIWTTETCLNDKRANLISLLPSPPIHRKALTSFSAVQHRPHRKNRRNPTCTGSTGKHLLRATGRQRWPTSLGILSLSEFRTATSKLPSNSERNPPVSNRNWARKPPPSDCHNTRRVNPAAWPSAPIANRGCALCILPWQRESFKIITAAIKKCRMICLCAAPTKLIMIGRPALRCYTRARALKTMDKYQSGPQHFITNNLPISKRVSMGIADKIKASR